ncbi:nucleotidyltransferase [Paenibacillus sediminis]|uniref:tRNA(Met) cytidine acetate ligase n=1 Tax=Paenibacillus sediminis TaxID=664909 RepID=A0ABS4H1R8_9BACL|nr:nucleotidyltransferase [Paenibacillus sediminis]MBP1936468.1 putative nucleotidyltransferase [Paenibacillus sediminis]
MRTTGIIVEYNPLHNGHVFHYTRAKQTTGADHIVAVMSGNFLQRGEPAVISKWARAEMALNMGADLVIELPVAYAVQPAEWFAYGAASLLEATGVVDSLCFGSEVGNLEPLSQLADKLAIENEPLKLAIASHLAKGLSYPAAYSAAAASLMETDMNSAAVQALLQQPNNTLALHYMIALKRIGSRIQPITIQREQAGYHDIEPGQGAIASATAIRKMLLSDGLESVRPYIPDYCYSILERELNMGRGPMHWERFRQPLMHALFTKTAPELAEFHEMTEGLEYRIAKTLSRLELPTVSHLLKSLKTKRYTHTKLQRALVHTLLNHSKAELTRGNLAKGPGYIRVLGFSRHGQALLKKMKKTAKLPVIMRAAAITHPQLTLDLRAAAAYANAYPELDTKSIYADYIRPPIQI